MLTQIPWFSCTSNWIWWNVVFSGFYHPCVPYNEVVHSVYFYFSSLTLSKRNFVYRYFSWDVEFATFIWTKVYSNDLWMVIKNNSSSVILIGCQAQGHLHIWLTEIWKTNRAFSLHANPLARSQGQIGLGQVKIMKEFVWINRNVFLNLVFRQVGGKN